MGGPGALDDIDQAHLTQAWLAVSNNPAALVTGEYFYHMRPLQPNPEAYDTALQDGLVDACARLSGVKLRALRRIRNEGPTLEEFDTGLGWAERETSPFSSVDKPLRIARRQRL